MQTAAGARSFSVLLTQDIAVIPMLAFLPLLASRCRRGFPRTDRSSAPANRPRRTAPAVMANGESRPSLSLVDGLPAWGVTLVTIGAIGRDHPRRHLSDAAGLPLHPRARAARDVHGAGAADRRRHRLPDDAGRPLARARHLPGGRGAGQQRVPARARNRPRAVQGPACWAFSSSPSGAGINFALLFGEPLDHPGDGAFGDSRERARSSVVLAGCFKLHGRDQWLFALALAQAGEFGFVLVSFFACRRA